MQNDFLVFLYSTSPQRKNACNFQKLHDFTKKNFLLKIVSETICIDKKRPGNQYLKDACY